MTEQKNNSLVTILNIALIVLIAMIIYLITHEVIIENVFWVIYVLAILSTSAVCILLVGLISFRRETNEKTFIKEMSKIVIALSLSVFVTIFLFSHT